MAEERTPTLVRLHLRIMARPGPSVAGLHGKDADRAGSTRWRRLKRSLPLCQPTDECDQAERFALVRASCTRDPVAHVGFEPSDRAVLLDQVFFGPDAEKFRQFPKLLDAPPARNPRLERLMAVKAPWGTKTVKVRQNLAGAASCKHRSFRPTTPCYPC